MKITQIRNATQIITYAGTKFLIDPMLAKKEAYPGLEGTVRSELRIPLVELPWDVKSILDVDAIIMTHTHPDHWDEAAVALIPKDKLIYVQNDSDAAILYSQGFTQLSVLSEHSTYGDISMIKTECQHGSKEAFANPQVAELLGDVSGIVFQHPEEKTLFLVGDTVWIKAVEDSMQKYNPDVVILNTGFAHLINFGAIIMGAEDVLKTHGVLPKAHIVATHMEALNHCMLSRKDLNKYVCENNIEDYVSVPEDGETIIF